MITPSIACSTIRSICFLVNIANNGRETGRLSELVLVRNQVQHTIRIKKRTNTYEAFMNFNISMYQQDQLLSEINLVNFCVA